MQLLFNNFSILYTTNLFITNTTSLNHANITKKSIENLTQINQLACDKETQLKIKFVNKANIIQIHIILTYQITSTQSIIANTKKANEVEQNKVIKKVIQLLYFYSSCEDQCNTL